MSARLQFQKQFAEGKVVNIGCGDVPVDFGPDTVQVDFDKFDYPNFVQADAHHLPFADNQFDTAVLGDMLEHCPDPVQVMREAGRVAKKVVATIFEEWRHAGLTIEGKIKESEDELHALGHKDIRSQYDTLPTFKDHCLEIVGDTEVPHHYHINNFTDEDIFRIVEEAGLEFHVKYKFLEGVHEGHNFYNWGIVVKKKEGV